VAVGAGLPGLGLFFQISEATPGHAFLPCDFSESPAGDLRDDWLLSKKFQSQISFLPPQMLAMQLYLTKQ
jgi:hypothetical protein